MSRRGLDSTSKVDGYELDSRRGIRKATLSRPRRLATWLAGSFTAAVVVLACVGVAASQAEPMPNGVPGTWQLKLNEEFSSSGLNTSLWTPGWQHGGISAESERCLSSALVNQPGDGYLHLWLRKESNTCEGTHSEYTGSLVESNPNDGVSGHTGFQYSYGYVEWRAYVVGTEEKCSLGGCIPDWPALWSLPGNHETEIDTMEGLNGEACYHFHPPFPGGTGSCAGNRPGWNTYGVNWEPGVVTFYYDGTQVGQVTSSKINSTPQYLVMDMTAPCSCGGKLVVPDELDIDYVRVWQHPTPPPPPPTVTTSAASGIQEEEATLNGKVNGNGLNTTYHFEYGETTSYGSSTPNVEVGSGSSSPSAPVSRLKPGTTYDYRLVAMSSAGTTYGANQTVSTLEGEASSRWAVRDSISEDQWIDYPGATERLCEWHLTSAGWGNNCLSGEDVAAGTSPTVVREHASGDQWIYYTGTSGRVCEWHWTSAGWGNNCLSGEDVAAGTSPTVVRDPSSGDQWIYYTGTSGRVCEWHWTSAGWGNNCLSGEDVAAGTSPTVVREHASGDQWVDYTGTSGRVCEWHWTSVGWGNNCLSGEDVATGTSPTVVRDPSSGDQWIYYTGTSGRVCEWHWTSAGWGDNCLSGEDVAAGTSPTVVREHASGDQWVDYTGTSGRVCEWHWTSAGWGDNCLSGEDVAAKTSPTVVREPSSGDQWIYYVGTSDRICEWHWTSAGWGDNCLTGEPVW